KSKTLRHHADNGHVRSVDHDRSPDNVWLAAVTTFPDRGADDRSRRGARPLIVLSEVAADERTYAADRERGCRDVRAGKTFDGAVSIGQRDARGAVGGERLEAAARASPVGEIQIGHAEGSARR